MATDESEPKNSADAAARDRATSLLGQSIANRYRIDEILAMGGMGAVYRGQHLAIKKRIAIKILHPDVENLPELVARFEREAIAGAHVQHPNVAAVTDFGTLDDGSYFLVLEYVRGVTLRELLRLGPLPPQRALRIARQIASALEAAHEMGIVHRDVKPRNVMLAEGKVDAVKLIDFGLAKIDLERFSTIEADPEGTPLIRLTGSGVIFGTIAYLAPEAALGMEFVDARSDLYALGVMLYEMVAGKYPFDAVGETELFHHHRTVVPARPSERAPGVEVPAVLEALVMRLLEKDPGRRYATATELIEAIDRVAAHAETGEAKRSEPAARAPLPMSPTAYTVAGVPSIAAPPLPPAEPAQAEVVLARPDARPEADPKEAAEAAPVVGAAREPPRRRKRPGRASAKPPAVPAPAARATPSRARVLVPVALGLGAVAFLAFTRDWAGRSPDPSPTAGRQAAAIATSIASLPPASSAAPRAASAEPPRAAAAASVDGPGVGGAASADTPTRPLRLPDDAPELLEARAELIKSAAIRRWDAGAAALITLGERAPGALGDGTLVAAARDVASGLERQKSATTERVFALLERDFGTDGLDVLYAIVETNGAGLGGRRALTALRDAPTLARATPALRIAFALREVPCNEKLPLLDRAVAEGDRRTLGVLETFGRGCFPRSNAIEAAISGLRRKLR